MRYYVSWKTTGYYTGKTAVLSADAGFLVKYVYDVIVKEVHVRYLIS